jgi:hypothetical protein
MLFHMLNSSLTLHLGLLILYGCHCFFFGNLILIHVRFSCISNANNELTIGVFGFSGSDLGLWIGHGNGG